jgi:acyl-CoA hydrolase
MAEMVLPTHTNAKGTVFGGVMMSWMDICAAICARRHARCSVVTAAVDELHFLRPVQLGDTVLLEAELASVGTTSMEILVKVARERINPDAVAEPTTEAYFTFVAIGTDGKPCVVPDIDGEHKEVGEERRNARLSRRAEKKTKS